MKMGRSGNGVKWPWGEVTWAEVTWVSRISSRHVVWNDGATIRWKNFFLTQMTAQQKKVGYRVAVWTPVSPPAQVTRVNSCPRHQLYHSLHQVTVSTLASEKLLCGAIWSHYRGVHLLAVVQKYGSLVRLKFVLGGGDTSQEVGWET